MRALIAAMVAFLFATQAFAQQCCVPGTIDALPQATYWNPTDLYACSQQSVIRKCLNSQAVSGTWEVQDVKAWGAVGVGPSVDDTVAVQNAINFVQLHGGGEVFFPTTDGYYCLKGGITLTGTNVRLVGSSKAVVLSSCGQDVTTVKMTNGGESIENLTVLGIGQDGGPGIGSVSPAVVLGSECIECLMLDAEVFGGNGCVMNHSREAYFYRLKMNQSYGLGLMIFQGSSLSSAGGWMERLKLDQGWPVAGPPFGITPNTRAASTHYNLGDVAVISGYFVQASRAGTTSSGAAPGLQNYNTAMTDGTVTWLLAAPSGFAMLAMDSYSVEVYGEKLDLSGAALAGFIMENTLSGNIPTFFRCVQCIASGGIQAGFWFKNGAHAYLENSFAGCLESGCGTIYFSSAWGGDASIIGGGTQGGNYGIQVDGGADLAITGVSISSQASTGIYLGPEATHTTAMTNFIAGGVIGIAIQPPEDYYSVIGNICNGPASACVSDAATGAHSTVTGNH